LSTPSCSLSYLYQCPEQRQEGYDLFGEERGQILISDVSKVDVYDGAPDGDAFEISTRDYTRRIFRADSKKDCSSWVAAINSAIKGRTFYRRETLAGISFWTKEDALVAPVPLMVTVKNEHGPEVVVSHTIHFGGTFQLDASDPHQTLCFLFNTGATAEVSTRVLSNRMIGDTVKVRVNTPVSKLSDVESGPIISGGLVPTHDPILRSLRGVFSVFSIYFDDLTRNTGPYSGAHTVYR